MANNYLEFSETIEDLTPEEHAWWLAEEKRIENAWNVDGDAWNNIENCADFSLEKTSVWFHCDECGDIEKVVHIVQKFFKKFRPKSHFGLTWAEWCSKPRIGEFGGGAVFVTADSEKWTGSHGWLDEQRKLWKEAQDG